MICINANLLRHLILETHLIYLCDRLTYYSSKNRWCKNHLKIILTSFLKWNSYLGYHRSKCTFRGNPVWGQWGSLQTEIGSQDGRSACLKQHTPWQITHILDCTILYQREEESKGQPPLNRPWPLGRVSALIRRSLNTDNWNEILEKVQYTSLPPPPNLRVSHSPQLDHHLSPGFLIIDALRV